jgi:hypothetical protein
MQRLMGVLNQIPDFYMGDVYTQIFNVLERGENVQLIGLKRFGKSFLLRNLEANQNRIKKSNNFPLNSSIILSDMELLADGSTDNILKHVFGGLLGRDVHSSSTAELTLKIREYFNAVRKEGRIVVLILDTVERLGVFNSVDFFNYLNGLHKENAGFLRIIFSFERQVDFVKAKKIYGDFVRLMIGKPIFMRRLNKKESEWFIESNNSLVPKLTISKEDKLKIIDVSAGYMFCIKRLFEAAIAGENLDDLINNPQKLPGLAYNFETVLEGVAGEADTLLKLAKGENDLNADDLELLKKYELIDDKNNFLCPVFRNYLIHKFSITGNSHTENFGEISIATRFTALEHKMFEYLYKNKGKIIKRDELIEYTWGTKSVIGISDAAINQLIMRLRSKLRKANSNIKIDTFRSRGVMLSEI